MKIFISSTFKDLRPERKAAIEGLQTTNITPGAMEFFASEPTYPLELALRTLDESDAVILLIGFRGGSLIPGSSQLTYTAAEFDRATERKKPVFVFIKTEDGSWKNEETDEPLKTALAQFKQNVTSSAVTPGYFENPDKLKFEVVKAIVNWSALGRPGARKTFATLEDYFPKPKKESLFDYEQTLRGRSVESTALDSFLKTDDKQLLVVSGRGGIGKSKFIKHWASTVTDRSILLLSDAGAWHEESDKEIPLSPVVIVADDAHRSNELPQLLACVKQLSESRQIKLILTTRPSGMWRLNSAVARIFDPSQVTRLALESLTQTDVQALAEEMLGASHKMVVPALVQLSWDTPLVTVIGGRLIARGEIAPELLSNEEVFRRAVFDKFVEEYEKNLPQSPVEWSSLLPLIAALGPIRPRLDQFKMLAEQFLKKRADEILQAIDILEVHGLLLRGGNLVRIAPDVLADYLLERACVNAKGEPTEYATVVFAHFGSAFLSNILSNLGELDWRIGHKYPSTSLLEDAWKQVTEAFQQADASGRVHLLKSLKEAAVFQPERTVKVIRFAVEHEATPLEQYGFVTSQQDVLTELPVLMQQVAYHFQYLDEMVRTLSKLAQQDTRRPNQYPDHASRIIKSLAAYGRYKPVRFNERMAEVAATIAKEPTAFDAEFTPLDVANELLAKEGEYSESEGYTIHLGCFALHYPVIRPVRRKALVLLGECMSSTNPKAVKAALKVVEHVLGDFLPSFGRSLTEDEVKWQDEEQIEVLEMLKNRIARPASIALQREILRIVRFVQARVSKSVAEKAASVVANIPQIDEMVIFDALCTNYWDRDHEHGDDIQAAEQVHLERVRGAAERFQRLYPEPQTQIEQLIVNLAVAREYQIDAKQSSTSFVNVLCENDEFVDELSAYLLSGHEPEIGHLMWCVLLALRNKLPEKYEFTALSAATHPNRDVAIAAANLATSGMNPEKLADQDAHVLAKLVMHPDSWVRRASLWPLARLGTNPRHRQEAVNLLLKVDIGEDAQAADNLFRAFSDRGIDMSSLSETEVAGFLSKFVPISKLDNFWIERFLRWAAEVYPTLVFDFVLKRLDRDRLLREQSESGSDYQPVPFSSLHSTFAGVQKTKEYATMLAAVRDRMSDDDIMQRFWLQNLFWSIGTLDDTTLHCLDEWLHSGDPNRVEAILSLAGKGPANIALSKPVFAVHAIECSAESNNELADAALGTFTLNAFQGTLTGNPGEPPPRLVSTKARAEKLRSQYESSRSGMKLFDAIAKHADETIERLRIDDEEFRFKN